MSRINIIDFLDRCKIPYMVSGPNVAQGNVNVKCPFCRSNDPSFHMGISISTGQWGCWRNDSHRGSGFSYLMRNLLGRTLTLEEAERMDLRSAPLSSGLKEEVESKLNPKSVSGELSTLTMPREFRRIDSSGLGQRFLTYLATRGYFNHDANLLMKSYDLRCALTGDYKLRIIFPIYYRGNLVAWTGRSIVPAAELRYKSNGSSIKRTLFNYDDLLSKPNPILCITEGPFDAMKLDYFGRDYGIRATCLFGTSISQAQVSLLANLKSKYQSIRVIFDQGALAASLSLVSKCAFLGVESHDLPPHIEDPGSMTAGEVIELCKRLEDNARAWV